MSAFVRASREVKERGTFGFMGEAGPLALIYEILKNQEKRA